jgi:hypothetical protein
MTTVMSLIAASLTPNRSWHEAAPVPEEKSNGIGLGQVASLLALAGAFFYTALRVAYGVFYSRLDVKPEDVGLGYQQILAQSVGALALLVLAAFVAAGVAAGFAALLRAQGKDLASIRVRDLFRPQPGASAGQRAGGLVVLVVVVGGALAINWKVFLTMVVVSVGALVSLTLYTNYRDLKDPRRARWVRIAFVSGFIMVGFLIVLVILCARAADDADAVRAGQTGTFEVLGIPITSWGAETGTLAAASTSASSPALPTGCVLYLGQADGIALAYDPAGHTVRLPVTQVVVSLDHGDRCP